MTFPWTEELIDLAKTMWMEGKSAGVIADRLGTSRNSVIGKLHRLNITNATRGVKAYRPADERVRSVRKSRAAAKAAKNPKPVPPPRKAPTMLKPDSPPATGNKGLLDLRARDCRWPVGAATGADQRFCAAPVEDGPYCPHCSRLAYAPRSASVKAKSDRRALYVARRAA